MEALSTTTKSIIFCALAAAFLYAINKIRAEGGATQNEKHENMENTQGAAPKAKLTFLHALTYLHKAKPVNTSAPTLLVCFGTYCGPCKAEIPHIARITKQFPDFNVVSAASEPKDKIYAFIEENPQCKAYSVAADESGHTRSLMSQYNVNGIPHCFLFDEKGDLAWHGHPAQVDPQLKKVAKAVTTQFTGKGRTL